MEKNRFEELRVRAGLTQRVAAEKIGVERSTVSKWETGQAMPRGKLLLLVAKTYNCSIDDLYKSDKPCSTGAM